MNGNDKRFENDASLCVLIIRLGIGMLFLFAGINKFLMGPANFAAATGAGFEDTWMPSVLINLFLYPLPYVEVLLGALLIVGLKTRLLLFAASLLLISLAFGMVLQSEYAIVSNNLLYSFMTAFGLFLSRYNRFSLDAFLCKGP